MKSENTGGKYTVIPTKEVNEFDEVVTILKDRLNDARRALRIIANNTTDPDAGKMAVTAYIATDTSLAEACNELNYLAEKRLTENWENDKADPVEWDQGREQALHAHMRGIDR